MIPGRTQSPCASGQPITPAELAEGAFARRSRAASRAELVGGALSPRFVGVREVAHEADAGRHGGAVRRAAARPGLSPG